MGTGTSRAGATPRAAANDGGEHDGCMIPAWMLAPLAILAICRLTRLVVADEVPFGAARRALQIRGNKVAHKRRVRVLLRRPDGTAAVDEQQWPALSAVWVGCAWCVSVTVAAGYVALCWWQPGVLGWVSLVLAASFVAGLSSRWSE